MEKRLQDMAVEQMTQLDRIDATLNLLLNRGQAKLADYMSVQASLTSMRSVLTQIDVNRQLGFNAKRDILLKQQEQIDDLSKRVKMLQANKGFCFFFVFLIIVVFLIFLLKK